jgi:hypothetical protein
MDFQKLPRLTRIQQGKLSRKNPFLRALASCRSRAEATLLEEPIRPEALGLDTLKKKGSLSKGP